MSRHRSKAFLGIVFRSLVAFSIMNGSLQMRPVTDMIMGFFPCVPGSVNISTQEDAQNCDLFVYAAVQLALDRVEEELERDQRRLDLFSVVTGSEPEGSDTGVKSVRQVLYDLYVQVSDRRQEFSALLRAAIGTDNYALAVPITSILLKIGLPILSHGLADDRLNDFSVFYRTIPSMDVVNQARLTLLARFQWYRIGLLGSSRMEYIYEMEKFKTYFNNYTKKLLKAKLSYEGTTANLSSSLLDLHKFDIRVIVVFCGPEEMRMVLCEASSEQYNLTTSDHVWILPSYYNPDWWKGSGAGYQSDQQTNYCTDEEIAIILNSMIFLDFVKYPPLETPLSEFYPALLNKTKILFALSPKVKLEPLLQHSRAVSAYDSTLLLARSLTEGKIDNDSLHSQIVCELCRIYPEQLLSAEDLEFCQGVRPVCRNSTVSLDMERIRYVSHNEALLTGYGQILITQFINHTHCPMVLFWPTRSITPETLFKNYVFLSSLRNLSGELELDPSIMFSNSVACPNNFSWKGRDSPPTSNAMLSSEIPEWALAFVGICSGLAEMLIVSFFIFNVIWRENKHVKTSSPLVISTMLVGVAGHIPYCIIEGIILSGTRYSLNEHLGTVLCQFNHWIPSIGITLFVTGLLMLIFRLYRIFNNKSLRTNLRNLRDRDLILSSFLLVVPIVLLLIIWNAISLYKFDTSFEENGNIQYVVVTRCKSDYKSIELIFQALFTMYILFLFSTTIYLSLFITGAPREIRNDVTETRLALSVGFLLVIAFYAADFFLGRDPLKYEIRWWMKVVEAVFGVCTVTAMIVLYQMILVFKDYWSRKKIKEKCCSEINKKCPKCASKGSQPQDPDSYYESLQKQIKVLSSSLIEKEMRIQQLRAQKHVSGDDSSSKL